MKSALRYLVGCDPEFILYEPINGIYQPPFGHRAQVGRDGAFVELRPPPSRSTLKLVGSIRRLLRSARLKKYRKLQWLAGGFQHDASLGGHIHFSRRIPSNFNNWIHRPGDRTRLISQLIKNLDDTVRLLEDLDILNTSQAKERRSWGDYGQFGDVRPSNRHFEYRTPISWLYHPETAAITLTACKLAFATPTNITDTCANRGYNTLRKFVECFRSKDDDADYLLEKILIKPLAKIQHSPDQDMKLTWRIEE